ncbi:hypothetical protein [Bradyrhizobium sp. dw_78]|uniref:hypothetical protein n=1 Tax=Bradyrhizobium sp. dw_78 TaxID=2719793 RepID=UPI001BD46957|nr:hypothetical protein [Bradyrhizobium sp. dw_78]
MSFVRLRNVTARVVMRCGIENFLVKIAPALAISLDEARDLARIVLNETPEDDDASGEGDLD